MNQQRQLSSPPSHKTSSGVDYTLWEERSEYHRYRNGDLEARVRRLKEELAQMKAERKSLEGEFTQDKVKWEEEFTQEKVKWEEEFTLEKVKREEEFARLDTKLKDLAILVHRKLQRDAERRAAEIEYAIPRILAEVADEKIMAEDQALCDLVQRLQDIRAPEHLYSISSLIINLYVAHTLSDANTSTFSLSESVMSLGLIPYTFLQKNDDRVRFLRAKTSVRWIRRQGSEFWTCVYTAFKHCNRDTVVDLNMGAYMKVESFKHGGWESHFQVHLDLEKSELDSYLDARERNAEILEKELHLGTWGTEIIGRARELGYQYWKMG